MLKRLLLTASAIAILVPVATAQEFVFRYKPGVFWTAADLPPAEEPTEPEEGDDEEAEIEAPEEMPDLEMAMTDFLFSHDDVAVPAGHIATDGYFLAAVEVENTGNVGIDFRNLPTDLSVRFSIDVGEWRTESACVDIGLLMPGQTGTCHVRSAPIVAETVCPEFYRHDENGQHRDTLSHYGNPGASLLWNGQRKSAMGIGSQTWTMNRIGCNAPEVPEMPIGDIRMSSPDIPGFVVAIEGWDRAPRFDSAMYHAAQHQLQLSIMNPRPNCAMLSTTFNLQNGTTSGGGMCAALSELPPAERVMATEEWWSEAAGVPFSSFPTSSAVPKIVGVTLGESPNSNRLVTIFFE